MRTEAETGAGDVATSREIPGPLEQEEAERTLLAPPEGEQTHRTSFQTSAPRAGRGRTPAVSGPHPHPAGGTLSRRPRDTDHREGQEGPPEDPQCGVTGAQQGHASFQNHGDAPSAGGPTPSPRCHGAGAQRGELGASRHVHPRPLTKQSTRPSL